MEVTNVEVVYHDPIVFICKCKGCNDPIVTYDSKGKITGHRCRHYAQDCEKY